MSNITQHLAHYIIIYEVMKHNKGSTNGRHKKKKKVDNIDLLEPYLNTYTK